MAKASTGTQKLNLDSVLQALDRQDLDYYNNLTDEEKKAYSPFILMRYMASAGPQSRDAPYAVIATNELVNKSLFELGKHPELQHKLLCVSGLGKKQYRPYVGSKNAKSSTKVVDEFFMTLYPSINATELAIPGTLSAISLILLITSSVRSIEAPAGNWAIPIRYCLSGAGTKPAGIRVNNRPARPSNTA